MVSEHSDLRLSSARVVGRRLRVAMFFVTVLTTVGCKPKVTSEAREPAPFHTKNSAAVGCFGRIMPQDGTIFVAPYVPNAGAPVVMRMLVKSGDVVSAGQPLAILAAQPYLEAEEVAAQRKVALAQAKLMRARAAGSSTQLAEQREEINRLTAQRDQMANELAHDQALYAKDYLSKAKVDLAESSAKQSNAMLEAARDRLREESEARPEDVTISEAELRVAEAELAQSRQQEASTVVRSPVRARVLRVTAESGEPVGSQGVAELAQLDNMEVVAEVYEADIAQVKVGEHADITSEFLPFTLHGTVQQIGSAIEKQAPLSVEPGSAADARIFRVDVQVDNPTVLDKFVNGKVKVVLHP
jgi:HlyD family secretion protein